MFDIICDALIVYGLGCAVANVFACIDFMIWAGPTKDKDGVSKLTFKHFIAQRSIKTLTFLSWYTVYMYLGGKFRWK